MKLNFYAIIHCYSWRLRVLICLLLFELCSNPSPSCLSLLSVFWKMETESQGRLLHTRPFINRLLQSLRGLKSQFWNWMTPWLACSIYQSEQQASPAFAFLGGIYTCLFSNDFRWRAKLFFVRYYLFINPPSRCQFYAMEFQMWLGILRIEDAWLCVAPTV